MEPTWESTQSLAEERPAGGADPTWDSTVGQDRFEGVIPGLKAAGLGAARSASFGLSDEFLVKSGMIKPEDLKAYKEFQPTATTIGEIGGVAGAILAPEAGLLGLAAAPTRAVLGAGSAVAKAALPAAEAISAGLSPAIAKIVSRGISVGAGSAVEGAAYGLGQTVSEHAIGDPDLNAEKVVSNIGMSAALGGALGGIFGAAHEGIKLKFPKFINEADKAAIESGDFAKTVEHSDLPTEEKQGILKSLTKQREDAGALTEFAEQNGLPLTKPQLSASEHVKRVWNMLLKGNVSISSIRQNEIAEQGWRGALKVAENSLGDGVALSKKDIGDKFVKSFAADIEKQAAPARALYQEIEPYKQAISVTDKSTGRISNNVRQLIKDKSLIKNTAAHNFVTTMADGLENVTNLQELKNFTTNMWGEAGIDTSLKHIAGAITEKLESLEMRSIKNFAEKEMKTPEAKQKILDLITKSDEAAAQWKNLRGSMEKLGDVFGKRRIYGPQDFIDFLNDGITSEKLASKVWQREDAEFMNFLQKKYPEQFELAKQFRVNQLKELATKKGYLEPKKLFQAVREMQPEERNFLFSKEQQKTLKNVEAYLDTFPKNYNPSGTAYELSLGKSFESPRETIRGNVRDYALEKFINNVDQFDPQAANVVSGLASIERLANKSTRAIKSGLNDIFSDTAKISGLGIGASTIEEQRKEYQKHEPALQEMSSDAGKLIDKLSESTQALSQIAPQNARAMQSTLMNASALLQSKLPGNNINSKPLSARYEPSNADIAKWYSYFNVVQNPTIALKQVASGTITPETMETLKVVYPKMLQEMQKEVTSKLVEQMSKGKQLPYNRKLALSMFLGSDLVNSLDPKSMLANQNVLSTATQRKNAQETMQMGRVNQKGLDKLETSNRYLTPMQQSAQRKDI